MIDIKTAVKNALDFISVLYSENSPSGLMLEEVELSEDEKFWLITIGFTQFEQNVGIMATLSSPKVTRVYKVIKIDANTGQAHSMKMRQT